MKLSGHPIPAAAVKQPGMGAVQPAVSLISGKSAESPSLRSSLSKNLHQGIKLAEPKQKNPNPTRDRKTIPK